MPHQPRQYTIQEFLGTTNFSGASFSPDNRKLLVSSDQSGIYNAYALPVAGGPPEQLTHSETESIMAISYFRHDERFLYAGDQGGNELHHLYVRELDGSSTDLTPGEGLKAVFRAWAGDFASFYFVTNERDRRYFDLYQVTVEGYQRRLIYQNDEGYGLPIISPDGRYLALYKGNTNADSDIYLLDRANDGTITHLTPHSGDINHNPLAFSRDSSKLYISTDAGREFSYLSAYDLAEGEWQVVLQADWDITGIHLSQPGSYLAVYINHDAQTELRLYSAADMRPVELPALPQATITSVEISPDESLLAFYASSSRMPQDLFVTALSGDQPTQLTRSLNPKIDPADLVDGQVIRFSSYDGLEIPGILYTPQGVARDQPAPALVWVHGGPGGQSRIGYNALLQFLINHGYLVYAINNRGSSGYGKTFFHLDDGKHGRADLDDCVAAKQMLIDTGLVEAERVGIIGGSYGGYMVLAALAFRPQVFDLGVDIFGISNWHRTLTNIPPWWESARKRLEAEFGPFADEDYFRSISPFFHAENIVKPLMVLQGANDPRVLQVESDDIVAAARHNGVPVEYVVFADEGHGFMKKENQARGYQGILAFLQAYL